MTVRTGRPRNSGLDDGKLVEAAEAAVAAGLHASERAAILAIAGGEDSVVRRLQRKLQRRRQARAGDIKCLADLGLGFGPAEEWNGFLVVPLGESGGRGLGLVQGAHLDRPLLMKMVGGTLDVAAADIPDHPVFAALDRMPVKLGWDDPGYRSLCAFVGLDPDRRRPMIHPLYAAYQAHVAGGGAPESPFEPRLSAFAPAGSGLDGARLAKLASRLHGEGNWESGEMAEAVRAAEGACDWTASETRADLELVRTPWTPSDHGDCIGVLVGAERAGGLYVGNDPCRLCVVREPAGHDLPGRQAARRLVERGLAVVVDADEAAWMARAAAERAGTGLDHPDRPGAEREHWTALAHAVASAYAHHAARHGGPPAGKRPGGLFSYPEGWEGMPFTVEWNHPPTQRGQLRNQFRASGTMATERGDLYLSPRGPMTALATSASHGLWEGDRRVRFTCTYRLPHREAPSALPLVGAAFVDFEACHVDDGSPVPDALALGLIASCMMPATLLIRDQVDIAPHRPPDGDGTLADRVRMVFQAARDRRTLSLRRQVERL